MPTARVVSVYVPVAATDTHFSLQFSTDGSTWTPYSSVNASPVTPENLAVALLDADEFYLLDGVNNPGGNEAAASYAGNWFQARLQGAGGFSNWSESFKAESEPEGDGPVANLSDLLTDFNLVKLSWNFEDQATIDAYAGRLLTEAMDEIRADEDIDALYVGGTSTRQTRLLARAERYLAIALALDRVMVAKATGAHEPLLMEDSTDLMSLAVYYRGEAFKLTAKIPSGASSSSGRATHPFSSTSPERTFTRAMLW